MRLPIKPPRSQCFDQTRPTFRRRPGAHAVSDAPVPKYAAVTQSHLWPAEKPTTDRFLRKGDGAYHPTADSSCSCHYSGTLIDGTKFDSSYDRGTPTDFGT